MSNKQYIDKMNSFVMSTYGRYPVVLKSGENCTAIDEDGKKYIDFGSGIGTNSLGYCNDEWADAVCAQVRAMQHTSNYFYTKVQAELAADLCAATGYAKAFFGNSGAEANECAIKLARKYSFDKYGAGRNTIITLKNSFHGRTLATLAATGQDTFHNYFFPFPGGFEYCTANDSEELKRMLNSTVCAVMLEFIQGEGGVVPLEKQFTEDIFRLCAEKDILVIADEVQTGAGRTGKLLAAEHYGVRADITTLAKGIAGGIPMGICLAKDKCADVLTKGMHGSTFGGNPLACAGATVVLRKLRDLNFLDEILRKGRYISAKLSESDEVAEVNGMGLMLGITLKTKKAADVAAKACENGLFVLTAKEKLRLLPPLTISYEDIEEGLRILTDILNDKEG